MGDYDTTKMILCSGCFCTQSLLYTDMPECIGCSGKSDCLCIQEQFCLRPGVPPLLCSSDDDAVICQLGLGICSVGLKRPTGCCKSQGQTCCVVSGAALPCDEDVPMTLAACGITCYPKVGVCQTLADATST